MIKSMSAMDFFYLLAVGQNLQNVGDQNLHFQLAKFCIFILPLTAKIYNRKKKQDFRSFDGFQNPAFCF
ncbi:MAG: hypothetical protein ACI3WU_00355 [Phascolarctobacterium sp.]